MTTVRSSNRVSPAISVNSVNDRQQEVEVSNRTIVEAAKNKHYRTDANSIKHDGDVCTMTAVGKVRNNHQRESDTHTFQLNISESAQSENRSDTTNSSLKSNSSSTRGK